MIQRRLHNEVGQRLGVKGWNPLCRSVSLLLHWSECQLQVLWKLGAWWRQEVNKRLPQEIVSGNSPGWVTLVTPVTWGMLQEIVSFPSLEAIKQAASGHVDARRQISLLFPLSI